MVRGSKGGNDREDQMEITPGGAKGHLHDWGRAAWRGPGASEGRGPGAWLKSPSEAESCSDYVCPGEGSTLGKWLHLQGSQDL